jgi:PAS domain S-box-containing protein
MGTKLIDLFFFKGNLVKSFITIDTQKIQQKISFMVFGFGLTIILSMVVIHYILMSFEIHGKYDICFIAIIMLIASFIVSRKIGRDIGDILEENKKIALENAKLKLAVEQSPISIVITDTSGNLEYVNPWFTKVTGYSFSEAIGQNPRILKTDFKTNSEYQILWDDISHNHTWTGIFKNKKKDGSYYWESAIITPIVNEKKEVTHYLGIKQEITEELYLKKQLQENEELMIAQSRHAAMGEMISMIAHQWRQPISVIAMGANNILADIELNMINEETLRVGARDIIEQTQHLSKTIDDFRNFFKPNKEVEDVSIKNLIDEVLQIMGKSLENNDIELNINMEENFVVKTFSRELLQVMINIIKNAKEVINEREIKSGEIWIDISKTSHNELCLIKVSDNGGGFEEELQERLFEPYFSTKSEKVGTGLGLYMSKIIIEKHLKGSINAYNQKEGACFEINIPIDLEKERLPQ